MKQLVRSCRCRAALLLDCGRLDWPCARPPMTFPSKPVRMIVPLSAGSAFDLLARAMGNTFKERTGQPIIVENRPGANQTVAANACKSAPPDGYTVCLLTQNAVTLNPLLYAKLSYDPEKDLDPVAVVAFQQQVLAVVPQLGVNTIADLVKYSKANPNKLNYGSLGLGSDSHLIMEWLKGVTGADITHVPFNGAPPILTAMKSGQVHMTLLTSGTLKPHIDSGDLKALLTRGSDKRNPALPDVPTFAEALPLLSATSWAGIFAPAGTPHDVIAKLNREFMAIISTPDFRSRYMVPAGLEPGAVKLDEIRAFMAKDRAGWEPLVKKSGVRLQ